MDELVRRALATATRDVEPTAELDRRVEAVLAAAPSSRRLPMLLAAAAVVVAVVAAAVLVVRDDERHAPVVTTPLPSIGGWELPSPPPLTPRQEASVVWTAEEVIVWGGTGNPEAGDGGDLASNDGAAYDPATRRWRPIADAPLAGRYGHHAAWTGTEMLVWGGVVNPSARAPIQDGAAYNPATDTWRRLAPGPLPALPSSMLGVSEASVWTGRELMVWGRHTGRGYALEGAAYDPAADRWRPLPPLPGPRQNPPQLFAVPGGVVAFGRTSGPEQRFEPGSSTREVLATVEADFFDEARQAWSTLPRSELSPLGTLAPAVADGELVVAGVAWTELAPGLRASGRYSFADGRWGPMVPFATGRSFGGLQAVWTGRELVVFAAEHDRTILAVRSWDPGTDTWRDLPAPPVAPRGRFVRTESGIVAWTGSTLLLSR